MATFLRFWGMGAQASLHLRTSKNRAWAQLNLGLGPASDLRPGAPTWAGEPGGGPGSQDHHHPPPPHPPRRPRRRGPAQRARDTARREAWWARRQEALAPAPPALHEVPPPPPSTPTPSAPSPSPSTTSSDPTTRPTQLITTLPPAPQVWSSDSLQEGVGVRLSRAPTIPQLDGSVVSPAPPAPPASPAPYTKITTPPPPRYVPPYRRNEVRGLWTDYIDDI